ncbi:MAG: adenosine kinase [Chrysiogenales bacterium]|nr:MAG: adenosine kinase [Chrysiogenales bacterium]
MEILNRNADYDVLGIGSALLDLTVTVSDGDLERLGLRKGEMLLIDSERSREILASLVDRPMVVTPGGSSANTLAGIAAMGGRGVFLGKVGNDHHGDRYIRDTEDAGVKADIRRHNSLTGHAITFITPDSERTFATHLGAALLLNSDDVREEDIRRSKIVHVEGYLFEPPGLREASLRSLEIARDNSVLVSIDLSDPGLIERIRDTLERVVSDFADIVFANEDEARAFTGKTRDKALSRIARQCGFAAVKLGSEGSIIQSGDSVYVIDVFGTDVVDTNGAGDMYAAGVLYGIARGFDPGHCGRIGSFVSSRVVSHVGARVQGIIPVDGIS